MPVILDEQKTFFRKPPEKTGKRPPRIVMFFTDQMSVAKWDQKGLLSREIKIYSGLRQSGIACQFFSYGVRSEEEYLRKLQGIPLLYNHWSLPVSLYRWAAPLFHQKALRDADWYKTNQIKGAAYAWRLSRLFGKKLIVRCGDLQSITAKERGLSGPEYKKIQNEERLAFQHADRIFVPTKAFQSYVVSQYGIPVQKTHVIPNYVDTKRFCPDPHIAKEEFLIGTVAKDKPRQKNLGMLIEALRGVPNAKLLLIGKACRDETLKKQARDAGVSVEFRGVIPNEEIPRELNRCELYVQPSLYEGHPKSLLEAMACGLPAVACNVIGVRDVVMHGQTGYLCSPSAEEIRSGIRFLLGQAGIRQEIGRQARSYVESHCSLDRVIQLEAGVYHEMAI